MLIWFPVLRLWVGMNGIPAMSEKKRNSKKIAAQKKSTEENLTFRDEWPMASREMTKKNETKKNKQKIPFF